MGWQTPGRGLASPVTPLPLLFIARLGAKLFTDDVVAGAFQDVFELPPINCRRRFGAGNGAKDHQGSKNGQNQGVFHGSIVSFNEPRDQP